jgi:mono/diheme cytochrome c family protein
MSLLKRFILLGAFAAAIVSVLVSFSMDYIKIEWISFMEIQPSYRPMEKPLPVPQRSIPVEGAAFIPGMGAPLNPIESDEISIQRGSQLYSINCAMCHGAGGEGNGIVGAALVNPPINLLSERVIGLSDGAIFVTLSNGVAGRMPALNANLTVRDRWDVVNYIRFIQAQAAQP